MVLQISQDFPHGLVEALALLIPGALLLGNRKRALLELLAAIALQAKLLLEALRLLANGCQLGRQAVALLLRSRTASLQAIAIASQTRQLGFAGGQAGNRPVARRRERSGLAPLGSDFLPVTGLESFDGSRSRLPSCLLQLSPFGTDQLTYTLQLAPGAGQFARQGSCAPFRLELGSLRLGTGLLDSLALPIG